jgi:hypothetical protein
MVLDATSTPPSPPPPSPAPHHRHAHHPHILAWPGEGSAPNTWSYLYPKPGRTSQIPNRPTPLASPTRSRVGHLTPQSRHTLALHSRFVPTRLSRVPAPGWPRFLTSTWPRTSSCSDSCRVERPTLPPCSTRPPLTYNACRKVVPRVYALLNSPPHLDVGCTASWRTDSTESAIRYLPRATDPRHTHNASAQAALRVGVRLRFAAVSNCKRRELNDVGPHAPN